MNTKLLIALVVGTANLWSQRITDRRTAEIRGGGGDGKCTIEVVVDDVAEVEVRGNNATIRTLSGAPATFRRFVCNQEMPSRPYDFQFKGIDGRGRQDLVRSPDRGGQAVVRIEDKNGGSEGYTFDLIWRGGSGGGGFDRPGYDRPGYGRPGYDRPGGGYNRPGSGGWNDGWGDGSGWSNNGDFRFEGGRRGSGEFRDRDGRIRRLDSARVIIGNGGALNVVFDSDRGRLAFSGNIDRRQGRRLFANVRGSGASGTMEIEMGSRDTVNRITIRDIDLTWTN